MEPAPTISEVISKLDALEKLVSSLVVQDSPSSRLLPIKEAAIALVGSSTLAAQMRLRRRVENGLYRLDKEVFDFAAPDSARKSLHFDIAECRKRDRTPRNKR